MRSKDAAEFDRIYRDAVKQDPDVKKYVCYLHAESQYFDKTGKRKYSNYESFRKCYSIRNRNAKQNLKR